MTAAQASRVADIMLIASQYLPLRDFDVVTNALNFSTPDCHVIGGCDLYTTKAAGTDKKLYKNIEQTLESQYESLVRLSASLSPPYRPAPSDDGKTGENGNRKKRSRTVEPPEIDLSRASPFGPLSQIGARRTFAYLIATLNASHPDYDFSHILRPSDFRKERSLRAIIHNVDSTLQHLRPKPYTSSAAYLSPPLIPSSSAPPVVNTLGGTEVWSPRMWSLIDKEMGLRQCEKYSYVPDDDPFDGEEGSLWSMHYFFFNKEKKRVCYLYLRGLSVISHSPLSAPVCHMKKKARRGVSIGSGAEKRASYWLGATVGDADVHTLNYDDDDEMEFCDDTEVDPEDDEIEVPHMDLDELRSELVDGYYSTSYDACADDDSEGFYYEDAVDTTPAVSEKATSSGLKTSKSHHVRGPSEEIGEVMEI
jgi:hypothetical protein